MNKEVIDALGMLLHCALKDTEYETQKEQFYIVSDYIENLETNWNELKKWLEEYFKGITIEDIPKDDFYKKGMYRMNEYTLDKMVEMEKNNGDMENDT